MAVRGHLLILLMPVFSLSGATEYYVRPTEPTSISCPAQPCLTLSQYTSDSDHYFKSNTVFNFLPGTHYMDRPVTIGNVHNVSLKRLSDESGEYPHLVAQFSCETEIHDCMYLLHWPLNTIHYLRMCCAAFWLHDVYNVTLKGITITLQTPNVSGVIVKNVSGSNVQLNTTCSSTKISFEENVQVSVGIAMFEATSVGVHSSTVNNCSYGLLFIDATNTHITNATVMYNELLGIGFNRTTDTHISNMISAYNVWDGIRLSNMNNTHITDTTAANNFKGLLFDTSVMDNTCLTNVSTTHNSNHGMLVLLSYMNNTCINNMTITHNFIGMAVSRSYMNNTCITNVTITHHRYYGMFVADSYVNNTYMTNITAMYNNDTGIYFSYMSNTHICNGIAAHNHHQGMTLLHMDNTYIDNTVIMYNEFGMDLSYMSYTHIINTLTEHNGHFGIYLLGMAHTHITKTIAVNNGKNTYSSRDANCGEFLIVYSLDTLIYNTSFTDLNTFCKGSAADFTKLPAIIVLYKSTLNISGCDFTGNSISAVRAHASPILISSDLTFSGNRAIAGTAFILISHSLLIYAGNIHIYFLNNHATNNGGVFYITNNNIIPDLYTNLYYPSSTCFLRGGRERNTPQSKLIFVNNSAGKGGDILYGGQVAFGLDGKSNCLDSFKNVSNISQNGLSLISSDPSRVCLCNGRGKPDCLVLVDPTPHSVYSGQTVNISAVVVGQDFGTVAGSVYAQFLQRGSSTQLESGQEVQAVTQHNCNILYYTIFSHSEVSKAVLVLTAEDIYVSKIFNDKGDYNTTHLIKHYNTLATKPLVYSNNPVYVNVSLLPCPPGFMLTTDSPFKCDCDAVLQHIQGIQCHIQEQTIGRSGVIWIGMIQDDNGTKQTVATSEYCSLDYCNGEDSNVTLSEPDSQCNYNHSGTLCGGCQPGLSLALGSNQCLQCSNEYLALLIPLTLAGPVLVFSIKLLDLTISQGTLNGLIFYANVVKANEYIFLSQRQTNPLTVFIAWLNLDLGVETCLFQGLTAYSKTWLQFLFPIYIWSIAGLIILLAKYSNRVVKMMGNNSVPVLATLFLLSYAKLLRTIITALSYTIVYTSHGPKYVWTADGNVDYLGPQHAPLFAIAVAVLLFLWLPYTLLLFLGQCLHRCNCRPIDQMLVKIKPFLDAHYDPLKSKHHYWFGTLLLVRTAILLISALVPANRSSIVVLCVLVSAVVLTHFGHLVYCKLAVAMFDISFFMNLVLLTGAYSFTTTEGESVAVSAYTLIGIAFVQFVGLVTFKLFSILRQSERVMGCLRKGQPVEDDWELYEQAALEREMESDPEEQDSEGSGSIESLPTY